MKYLIIILLFPLFAQAHIRDTVPSGVPQLFGSKYYKFNGYVLIDSFIMNAAGDTNNIPYFPSLKFKSSDNRWYGYDRTRFQRFLWATDTTNLLATQYDLTQVGGASLNNIGAGFRWVATPAGNIKTAYGSNTIILDSSSNANGITSKADTSVLATQYDLTLNISGLQYMFSATALTGNDTTKLWIKAPAIAGVYDVLTYVSTQLQYPWQRFGWLSVDGVFSTKRPLTVLICGQSNAVGIGTGGDTSAMPGIIGYSSGVVWNTGLDGPTFWRRAQVGLSPLFTIGGVGTNNIGFQVAKQIKKHGQADIVRLMLVGEGGTSLASWIGDGDVYLLDSLRTRLARSGIDTIDVFCWHQGESGGIRGFELGGYVVDQRILWDSLCSPLTRGFIRNYTKYVAGGLGNATDSNIIYNVGSPEGGQRTLNWDGNLNTGWVPSWGIGLSDFVLHFSGTGLDSLGYRYFTETKRLPHTSYEEQPPYNFDTTYDGYRAYETRQVPYSGGGGAYRIADGTSFGWRTTSAGRLFTINGSENNVIAGELTGYSNTVNKMLQVNGKALISDGSFNTIIAGNMNVTGDPEHNVVVANYTSSMNGSGGGNESVLMGFNAGYNTSRIPFNSTMVGSEAGNGVSPSGFGDYLTYFGRLAGAGAAGITHTFIGGRAGQNAQGSYITALGQDAGPTATTAWTNSTAIGANAKYSGDSMTTIGSAQTRLRLGGRSSNFDFDLTGTPANGNVWLYNNSNSRFELSAVPGDGNGIYSGSGTLPSDITVSTGGFTTTWSGSNDNETSFNVANTGTTNANAISGTATGTTSIGVSGTSTSYIGVYGSSTSNTGVQGQSSSGVGVIGVSSTSAAFRGQINPTSTNAIENIATLLRTSSSGGGANGLGAAIQYELETATNGTSQIAGSLAFKWTDATNATRTSQMSITGVNSTTTQTIATFDGDGTYTTIGRRIIAVTTSSAGTLTLGNSHSYVFSGTTTTWTLPAVSGTTGVIYYLKNRGSGDITLNAAAAANEIYSTSAVNTYTIGAGAAITLISDGTYWTVN